MLDGTEANEPRVFIIPSNNLPTFQDKLAKLQKKAFKLKSNPPTYTVVKEETKSVQVVVGKYEDINGTERDPIQERCLLLYHIVIQNPTVILAGYQFCATIEHTEEGNILHTLKGHTIPLKYREGKPYCDHCKTLRRRNDTFVLRKLESEIFLQVGRNCLADFLGWDAERYASIAELSYEIDELGQASEGGFCGGSGPIFDYLERYLAYVAECITLKGWRSRTTAKEYGGAATADIAYTHLHPTPPFLRYGEVLFRTPSEQSLQSAKDAIMWAHDLPDAEVETSEYLHNIRLIARRGIVGARQYGFAASIVSGYQRHVGELVRKKSLAEQALVSQYVGTVGKRLIFTLMVDHVVALPDYGYGSSSLHLMSDQDGNRFTWKSSSHTLDKGQTYALKGTIKKHEDYKGVKQTQLSRCAEVKGK